MSLSRRNPPKKKIDLVTMMRLLRKRGGKRPWWATVLMALALTGCIWLGLWRIWPGGGPREFVIVAHDRVIRPGDEWSLVAQMQPADAESVGTGMAGYDIYFQGPLPGMDAKVQTDDLGVVQVRHAARPLDLSPAEFVVRFLGDDRHWRGAEDAARIYVWPADSSILLIDADCLVRSPVQKDEDAKEAPPDAPPAETLRGLQERYRIAYFSVGSERLASFLELRNRIRIGRFARADRFPDGPLFSRQPHEADELAALCKTFTGPIKAVAGSLESAQRCQALDVQTYYLGEASKLPDGAIAIKSWSALAERLRP